ncbi:hypothetical protein GS399_10040 [Pedobacter sp. HMF7647]|uniref:Asl1-like glycosyl hydrolase catalytic domain-containing protein n=1 Tax=Hufsiella arboris TaxID=2695275 RepID=A0A7K1YB80_9SPHI|nr:glycosyl hydrolase [Hufsiella arboris]MXV51308.1 hypothetical protein [Hufsiella arboris]
MLRTCYTFLALILCLTLTSQDAGKSIIWGINGHPLTKQDYKKNWPAQIQAIKDLKLSSYRFDLLIDTNGYARDEESCLKLFKVLKSNNIAPLPAIMQKGFNDLDLNDRYRLSYKQGQNFALRYGEYLSVIEVNNEVDVKSMLSKNFDGRKQNGYDNPKLIRYITAIKGFIDGLKQVKPSVKVTLSFSWLHFYYLTALEENNVNYDIIGCHWYSNMGDITNVKSIGNVLELLRQRYKKPIWITEFNYFKGTTTASLAKQNEFLSTSIHPILAQNIVTGFFIYELYDQPAINQRSPGESKYGLISQDSQGNLVKKDAYMTYKQIVAGH